MPRADAPPSPAVAGRLDLAVVLALALVTIGFLLAWPRKLGNSDESYFLYQAKRLSEGEVMYRDVFDFITPLAMYVMAAAYRVLGTTLETARLVTAAVHASAVCLVYLAARRLGVRRVLAVAPALALAAFGYPTFPEASSHWFATALMALLALGLVGWRWDVRSGPAFALGVVDGAIIAMQQQKGAVLGVGLALILVLVTLVRRRVAGAEPGASLVRRLAALAAGACVVAGMVLGASALAAGVGPVFDAVVRYPLESYAPAMTIGWGDTAPFMDRRAIPATVLFFRYLPLAVLVPAGRALAGAWSDAASDATRTRLALVVFAASSALAVAYYPDFIHIAFIAPAFLVGAADSLEWIVARVPARTAVAWAIGALLLAVVGWRAADTLATARAESRITHQTAFGVVDFAVPWQAQIVDRLRRELDADPMRTMFAYPQMASPYLLAGGRNPTPFQMFNAPSAPRFQIEHLLDVLERSRPPVVVTNPHLLTRPHDPIARWIDTHYEPLDIPEIERYGADIVMQWIYRRR
jgi:hypothetical protein